MVIQSSAPRRSPRTRCATVDWPVQTTIPSSGSAPQRRSSHSHACGPRTARSTTRALSRIDTTASVGTGLASTRCSQPSRSRRLLRTWMKPLSRSRTAMRRAEDALPGPAAAASSLAVIPSGIERESRGPAARESGCSPIVTGCSQDACAVCGAPRARGKVIRRFRACRRGPNPGARRRDAKNRRTRGTAR